MCQHGPMKRIVIAGVTGSIGTQAVEVLAANNAIEIVGMGAGRRAGDLFDLATQAGVTELALAAERFAEQVPDGVTLRVGAGSIEALISELKPDLVLNALVGYAGLSVTRSALESGADVALANKESLVAAGHLVKELAAENGCEIIPVDSEHASLAQLLEGVPADEVSSLTLTASGGPFRGWTAESMANVTVEEALNHPTWAMGGKITIDSATMMNKGLELIEAHHLFGFAYEDLNVLVHPQSIVHALVELADGMQLAHMGMPDMKAPIAWAVEGRTRRNIGVAPLDLAAVGSLTFEEPDLTAFAALPLAIAAGSRGGSAPAVLNAANEVAVTAFLEGRIPFGEIIPLVAGSLGRLEDLPGSTFAELDEADSAARAFTAEAASAIEVGA